MNLHVLKGSNFCGRSGRQHDWVGSPSDTPAGMVCGRNAYIGPDSVSSFSGIAPTVAAEIDLMARDRDAAKAARRALENLGFGYCLPRNPFTLSGGEQVVATIVAATAGRPERLAIDCAMEQLSHELRQRVMSYLATLGGDLMVADNRLDEWYSGPVEELHQSHDAPRPDPECGLEVPSCPAEIQLVDLGFAYAKGQPVFTDLNATFEAGRSYTLRGRNGAGKSTLSRILCGLLRPSTGEIRVDGRRVEPWRTPGRFVAYHFQNPDYQLFAGSVRRQFADPVRAESLASYFGLGRFLDTHPLDLPYVLKKRTAIAASFSRGVGAVILDEPTIGQDKSFVSCLVTPKLPPAIIISHSMHFSSLASITLGRVSDD